MNRAKRLTTFSVHVVSSYLLSCVAVMVEIVLMSGSDNVNKRASS